MAKIVQSLTRPAKQYDENVAANQVRDLDAVIEKLNTTFQQELKQEIEAKNFFLELMSIQNQYLFYGVAAQDLSGVGANMFGAGNPLVSETYIIKSLRVMSVGTPTITVKNNGVTVIKTIALTANVSLELLTQPLIVEGGTTLTIIASASSATDVGISYLNIKKTVLD
jgi:hypothetical protein